jgi:NitT/TauT family transport system ATP-binding protein
MSLSTETALLSVENLSHAFGARANQSPAPVLSDITITAPAGQFVSIVGPSGCGKSTLLTMISGLEAPSAGTVRFQGSPVTSARREFGFIFQRDALLPWKSLADNVSLPLRYRGISRSEASATAEKWLDLLGLAGLGRRYPYQVSGGQRKRAAIAATMVYEPRLMLMDEPFGALDVQTRDMIETDILRIWGEIGSQTVFFVTHDLEEAVALGDRVIVISRGPGRVIADYAIDLPRPRDVREIRTEPAFREYYEKIWETLRAEVDATRRPAAS